jgi:tRNA threonylcarbamoyladenosine biosynthesis protein TsaB
MLVLALDTCDSNGSVAVLRDGAVVETIAHTTGEGYSSWLLPAVEGLLGAASAKLADIDLFAVATGPGSFTGVRLGLTTVKAWGEVFGKPIAGMSRLEVLANEDQGDCGIVGTVLDAQRGQVFAALYKRDPKGLILAGQESVTTAADFLAYVSEESGPRGVAWVGTDARLLLLEPRWHERVASGEGILEVSSELAPLIGKLGMRKAEKGQVHDALSLDANYVRRSYVETAAKPST